MLVSLRHPSSVARRKRRVSDAAVGGWAQAKKIKFLRCFAAGNVLVSLVQIYKFIKITVFRSDVRIGKRRERCQRIILLRSKQNLFLRETDGSYFSIVGQAELFLMRKRWNELKNVQETKIKIKNKIIP